MFAPTAPHWGNLDNELRTSQPVLSWSIFTLERNTEARLAGGNYRSLLIYTKTEGEYSNELGR